jgi:hypothetical protein
MVVLPSVEEHKFEVFESKVLMKMFGNMEEITYWLQQARHKTEMEDVHTEFGGETLYKFPIRKM